MHQVTLRLVDIQDNNVEIYESCKYQEDHMNRKLKCLSICGSSCQSDLK